MRIVDNKEDIFVCGHRGYMARYPENSLLAVFKAIEAGVDAVEIDLHYTKDKKIVLLHDDRIDRTTNGTGLIKDLTLQELDNVKLYNPNGTLSDEKIPTFIEYLEMTKAYPELEHFIEIKTQDDSVELFHEVYEILKDYDLLDSLLTTFDYRVTKAAIEKNMPVQSFGYDLMKYLDKDEISEDDYLKSLTVIGLFINSATPELVVKYKEYGLQMTIVPIDSDEDIEKATQLGLNLLACNEIQPAIQYRNRLREV